MSDRCFIFINIAEKTGDQRIPLYGSDKLDPEVLERQLDYGGAGKGHSTKVGESSAPHMLQTQPAPLFPYGETEAHMWLPKSLE